MSLRSPLGRVLGLGSAKEGTEHWWSQRLSAVALVPLGLWFAASLAFADSLAHEVITHWLQQPLNAVLMILLVSALLYHSKLGVQVVIEDYVHGGTKVISLLLSRFAHIAVGVAAVYAVLRVSFGQPG